MKVRGKRLKLTIWDTGKKAIRAIRVFGTCVVGYYKTHGPCDFLFVIVV